MTDHQPPVDTAPGSDFGPRGYLPERAARRARKIVLRQPMGLQWPIAAGIAAVAVLVIGVIYLTTQMGAPGAPFLRAGNLADIDPRGADIVTVADQRVLIVRGAGGLSAFSAPDADVVYCRESRRVESADGRVWLPDGRLAGGGGQSLAVHTVRVHDGVLYVDPEPGARPPAVEGGTERTTCS